MRNAITGWVERWKESLEKGVKVRFIVYKPQEEKALRKILQTLKKKGSLSIRCTSHPPPAALTIFDGERIMVATSSAPEPLESPGLWVKNPSLAEMFKDYFELMWQASEDEQEKTK
jgi:hypothetical protein